MTLADPSPTPNLIGVYDYAEGEERPYLVMEYVAGDNLAERMARHGEIDCGRLARELLGALAHIHAARIVHRDVKPQNILIAPDGSAKLIDFGIALPKDATALTSTGNLLGTARCISAHTSAASSPAASIARSRSSSVDPEHAPDATCQCSWSSSSSVLPPMTDWGRSATTSEPGRACSSRLLISSH